MKTNYAVFVDKLSFWRKARGQDGSRIHIFDGITLAIQEGEIVAIVGPSGCGKTTLLHFIAGLLYQNDNIITLWGEPIKNLSDKRKVGFVFQSPTLMPWRTVRDNIGLPLELNKINDIDTKIKEVLALVGLNGFEDFYPHELSGGMRTRVNLGRAFIGEPDLLLLDEPFAHLDELSRMQLAREVLDIRQNRSITIILVTHDISEAVMLSDRVVILSSRPATIQLSLDITLPRPRSSELITSKSFQNSVQTIRFELEKLSYR